MLTGHDRGKQVAVGGAHRVELGIVLAVFGAAPAQAVEFGDSLAFELHMRQGAQVALIGLLADLIVTPEVGYAFAHRYPAPRVLSGLQNLELARIVDRGFDA